MNIQDIVRDAHSNAKAKGWHDEERSFGELIALCHSELSEALEAYRDGWKLDAIMEHRTSRKPEGIPIELADCIIRIADMLGKYEINVDQIKIRPFEIDPTFGEFIAAAHYTLSKAYFYRSEFGGVALVAVIKLIEEYSARHEIDLDEAIRVKMEYNLTRDLRHGGKVI